ncbi:CBS domain-containing protein [Archaeoglobus profundus]|uniref:Signal transduction protein with CBS domains n=1 Tax=Archaeoglobus profundus (strain DSM 5631 / JCM 9629 / NBRC 100127 / Av18) TaxID=572546 RepID=D2RGN1_ARCPA|nr:CBS domain-containing protein [Archaeoglobus profundus]ADB57456.1 putative signal transduction protein with CBS domains [Archaeoglobus profundus DSM 5631]
MVKVGDAMVREIVSVDYRTPVKEVVRIMGQRKIGSVLVSRNGEIYGIFTERDLVSKVLLEGSLDDDVGKYTSTPLITVSLDYDLKEATRIMSDMKIKRLVVVEDGKIVGILTASDVVRAIAKAPLEVL